MLGTALLLLIALLAVSVPVAAVMGVLGLALNQFFCVHAATTGPWVTSWSECQFAEYILISIPLFVMLGEILLRSGHRNHRVYAADCDSGCRGCRAD